MSKYQVMAYLDLAEVAILVVLALYTEPLVSLGARGPDIESILGQGVTPCLV